MLDEILAMEHQVWRALQDGDSALDETLLHKDFLGVYATGFSGRGGHTGQLAAGPVVLDYEIRAPRLLMLAPDTALLAYLAHYRRPARPAHPEAMYVSSIWRREAGTWRSLFSQDTDVRPATA